MCMYAHTHILTHTHSQPRPVSSFWQTSLRDSRQISKLLLKTLSVTFLTLQDSKAEIIHRNNNTERSSTQLTKKLQTGLYVQLIYLEIWLIYNFVLVSCIWQSDTDMCVCVCVCVCVYGFPGGSGNYILIHINVTVLEKVCVFQDLLTRIYIYMASLVAQLAEKPPAKWQTRAWSLGWEDPLEKGMATHSYILAWRIPWTEEPSGLQFVGL